jgi:hypothetical protein
VRIFNRASFTLQYGNNIQKQNIKDQNKPNGFVRAHALGYDVFSYTKYSTTYYS